MSRVTFVTLRHPEFLGLGNFVTVLKDGSFWQAMGFSLRFAVLASAAQLVLGLALAVFLAPLFALAPAH